MAILFAATADSKASLLAMTAVVLLLVATVSSFLACADASILWDAVLMFAAACTDAALVFFICSADVDILALTPLAPFFSDLKLLARPSILSPMFSKPERDCIMAKTPCIFNIASLTSSDCAPKRAITPFSIAKEDATLCPTPTIVPRI